MRIDDAELAALLSGITIAHQIPGRVRLKLLRPPETLRAKLDTAALARFLEGLRQISGITQIKLNALARSATIAYAPALLPDHVWREAIGAPETSSQATRDFLAKLRQQCLEA